MSGNLTVVVGRLDKSLRGEKLITPNSMLLVADVRNEEKLAALINTAIGKIGKDKAEKLFPEREYMGIKVRTLKNPEENVKDRISYTLYNGKLFFSMNADGILEKVIAEIKNPQNPAAKNPDVATALKRAPKSVFSIAYMNLPFLISQYCDLFEQIQQLGNAVGSGKISLVNPDKRPRGDALPWIVLSHGREGVNELIVETVFFRKEAK
jgi:hypothetical protein